MALEAYLYLILKTIYTYYDEDEDICCINKDILLDESNTQKKFLETNLRRLEYRDLIKIIYASNEMYEIRLTKQGLNMMKKNTSCLLSSAGEKEMYNLLKSVFSDEFSISVKVGMIYVINDKSKLNNLEKDFAYKSHLDFIIGDLELNPIAAIEYDGNHNDEQIGKDSLKNDICKSINLPIIRLDGNDSIDVETLASRFIEIDNKDNLDFQKLMQKMHQILKKEGNV